MNVTEYYVKEWKECEKVEKGEIEEKIKKKKQTTQKNF